VSSKVILSLTFNRNLNYPSAVWRSCCPDELNLLQREAVRLLLDTTGYLVPPIPQRPPGDSLSFGRGYRMTSEQIFCRVEIKPSGKYPANWIVLRQASPQDMKVMRFLRRSIEFFPAIDSDGNPARFSGYAIIHRLYSGSIRIEFAWLNGGRLSSPADKVKQPKEIR
jgi:hypothetical protein